MTFSGSISASSWLHVLGVKCRDAPGDRNLGVIKVQVSWKTTILGERTEGIIANGKEKTHKDLL